MDIKPMTILIVDDNPTMRDGMREILSSAGYPVEGISSGEECLIQMEQKKYDLIITDYKMSGMSGLDLLRKIKGKSSETEVIVITAYGTIEIAVEAMKAGAWDFITKPFSKDELLLKAERIAGVIRNGIAMQRLEEENRYLKDELTIQFNTGGIIGESEKMRSVYRTIDKVAGSDTSVLILGESGTGKELIARTIHENSPRNEMPFIRVNCGALAEGVLESELFGHEKGAFTGALRRKKGRFELAHSGSLFLDEIGDIPLSTQVKLLRVLQEREFERVGGEETLQVDVRVIAATHRDLLKMVREDTFREDLYYRLNILPIHLPPLRERKEDISLLADHFLGILCRDMRKKHISLSDESMALLKTYDWPGNIRELGNIMERVVVLSDGQRIETDDLKFLLSSNDGTEIAETSLNLDARLAALEKHLLREALKASGNVKAKAARILGIKESALYYKLEKYDLSEKRT